jgi:DNA repair protein RadC
MEKQLPLFAYELTASAQQTIREALTLLERQLRARRIVYVQQLST